MDQADTPTLDPDIFQRNMAALRHVDPALTERLENNAESSSRLLILAVTRDGKLNFQLPRSDGTSGWFGRTSIPKVRAEAMLARFQAGNANVLLPGIGEGTEVYLLTKRLSRHRAIFVWEEDEQSIQLALKLHDLADAIEHQRLIFIVCPIEELTSTLVAWLEEHPGHLCPNRIMLWPWHTIGGLAACQAAVEAAFGQIEQRRRKALDSLRNKLAQEKFINSGIPADGFKDGSGGGPSGELRIALFALHALDETWALTDALSAGASALDWHPLAVDLRTPGDVHALSRVAKLAEATDGLPNLAILINITRNEVQDVLPEAIPAVCWLGRHTLVDADLPKRISGQDVIVTTNGWLFDRALESGVDPRRLSVCPPPCLSCLDTTISDEPDNRPIDVLILADIGPTDPASFGHQLDTHSKIWKVAVDLLKARIETFADDQIESIVARAESKANARIEDKAIRLAMADALGTVVARTLLWQYLAHALVNNDFSVDIYGDGWLDIPGARLGGAARTVGQKNELTRKAKILVYADATGAVSLEALLAAGNGAVLVARGHPRDSRPGGLQTILESGEEVVFFSYVRQLVGVINQLLQDDTRRWEIAQKAHLRCQAEHTPAKRLEMLRAVTSSDSLNSPS